MQCSISPAGTLPDLMFVVILSRMGEKILLSRHRARSTWETQGGHIEPGETPEEAARRELYEESGAVQYTMIRAFDYRAWDEHGGANGAVFIAEITQLSPLPLSEMAEVRTFDALPENLTYPGITPVLWTHARAAGMI